MKVSLIAGHWLVRRIRGRVIRLPALNMWRDLRNRRGDLIELAEQVS